MSVKPKLEQFMLARMREDTETAVAIDVSRLVSDKVHDVIKLHAIAMPTVSMAIALGLLAAHQILSETITFAVNSMDGDQDDEAAIRAAAEALFAELRAHPSTTPEESAT